MTVAQQQSPSPPPPAAPESAGSAGSPSAAVARGPADRGPSAPLSGRLFSGLLWKVIAGCCLVAAVAVAAGGRSWWGRPAVNTEMLVLHAVQRQDLPITVIERGNLESQEDVPLLCEVDDFRRDGINGTPIVWIIPNGSLVAEGDLLVELDSSPVQEQLDEQILETEQARELVLLAEAKYENQESQNETDEEEAKLKVQLAELELRMFEDDTSGTHRLEVEEIRRAIEDLNNEILAAQANLELKRNEKDGIETLFKLGYAGKSEFERSQLDFLQAESTFASKVNRMETQLATLRKKETYEREMRMLDLSGKLDTARRSLEQVLRNNDAQLTQLKASLEARKEQLSKEEELLERYRSQYDACKLYAPQSGMVAYADSRDEEIRAGAAVRMRQKILSIPKLTRMQVRTAIHESVLDQVKQGLKARIRVDAFSDRSYEGTVHSVAVLPQSNRGRSGDTRYYETIVQIDQDVEQLKPGMTAVVEVLVANLQDVVVAPVQSIVEIANQSYVFAAENGAVERVPVSVGMSNDHLVEIPEGIEPGRRIVLNPMALGDEYLGGDGQDPAGDSNEVSAVSE